MGDVKRRRALGIGPRNTSGASPEQPDPMTSDEARKLTDRDGTSCWTWIPTRRGGLIVGATTYVTYRDDPDSEDDDYEDGESRAWVVVEADLWDNPDIGERNDFAMDDPELANEVSGLKWYRSPIVDRFELPDFSVLKLRALGCIHPAVLGAAREFDLSS